MGSETLRRWFLAVSDFYYKTEEYLDELRRDKFQLNPNLFEKMDQMLTAQQTLNEFLLSAEWTQSWICEPNLVGLSGDPSLESCTRVC